MSIKAIRCESDVQLWLESSTCKDLLSFLENIANASRGGKVQQMYCSNTKESVIAVVTLLSNLTKLVSSHPPVNQPQRYGNTAFRGWFAAVEKESKESIQSVLEKNDSFLLLSKEQQIIVTNELSAYWVGSFGNSTRIDYGTGHEASFLMFLQCLGNINVLNINPKNDENHLRDIALLIYPTYLSVARLIQRTYMLEPAGSHGVWSLDDYCFLPFLFGSAQLIAHKNIRPRSILYNEIIEGYSKSYMYLSAIEFINVVKTGPFQEHSHILYEISKKVSSWEMVYKGLMRMFLVEVLGKFPVAQHFYFGTLLKPTWLMKGNSNKEEETKNTSATATTTTTTTTTTATTKITTTTTTATATSSAPKAPTTATMPNVPRSFLNGTTTLRRPTPIPMHQQFKGGTDVISKYFVEKGSRRNISRNGTPRPNVSEYTLTGNGINIKGWIISSNKGKMTDSIELSTMETASTITFPTPEIVFGHNSLRFEHISSGICIDINALDGLRSCIIQEEYQSDNDDNGNDNEVEQKASNTISKPNRTLVKYALAEAWANRKDHGIEINTKKDGFENLDWTYTPVYHGTILKKDQQKVKQCEYYTMTRKLKNNEIGINYNMLKDQTIPILWYDVIELYETELDDCGSGTLEAKVRVMPNCFFVLIRWWLRVDDTMVRIFDTRIFCNFIENNRVVYETVQKEILYSELQLIGQSINNKDYKDPNVFSKILKEVKKETRVMDLPSMVI